jgi:hypothetical protein
MLIPWIEVIERDVNTYHYYNVINSYPFPDVDISEHTELSVAHLLNLIEEMKDEITKECYKTRIHFILNRWHPKNFVFVEFKEWKYG